MMLIADTTARAVHRQTIENKIHNLIFRERNARWRRNMMGEKMDEKGRGPYTVRSSACHETEESEYFVRTELKAIIIK